jgi:hypothetical protein
MRKAVQLGIVSLSALGLCLAAVVPGVLEPGAAAQAQAQEPLCRRPATLPALPPEPQLRLQRQMQERDGARGDDMAEVEMEAPIMPAPLSPPPPPPPPTPPPAMAFEPPGDSAPATGRAGRDPACSPPATMTICSTPSSTPAMPAASFRAASFAACRGSIRDVFSPSRCRTRPEGRCRLLG